MVMLSRIMSIIQKISKYNYAEISKNFLNITWEYIKSGFEFRRIQKYIIKQFLFAFLVSSVSLTLLAVVFNLVMDMNWFLANPDVLRNKFEYILLVYVLRGPHLYSYLAPLCMLISISYVVSRMSRNFELVAIVNAGVSLKRLFAPFITITILISILYFLFLDQVMTAAGKESRKIERVKVWGDLSFLDSEYIENIKEPLKSQNKLVTYVEIGFVSRSGEMRDVRINKFYEYTGGIDFESKRFEGGLVQYTITARYGKWDEKIKNWILYDAEITEFDKKTELVSRKKLNTYTPDFKLDEPSFFFPMKYDFMFLTMSEMTQELNKSLATKFVFGSSGYYQRLMQMLSRPSLSFSLLISVLISLGFVTVISRNLTFVNMVFQSVIRYVLYFITFLGGVWLGENRILPPIVAVWIPNLIFVSYAIYLNYKVKT
ncbi:MAG: LptF/LptG family permease [Spirochaetia bacterium]|nr:LptF/LptG family permease [Spirochaetota bacterium]MDW8112226.1 LptF/LptG family permease [Spirochaetia bacterium]